MKGGGFICGLVFNTTQPGLAYCRTDVGSSYSGTTRPRSGRRPDRLGGDDNLMGSESIATDPIDPQRVYIAAGMRQADPAAILAQWTKAGLSNVDVPFRMGGNENGRGVGELTWPSIPTTTTFSISARAGRALDQPRCGTDLEKGGQLSGGGRRAPAGAGGRRRGPAAENGAWTAALSSSTQHRNSRQTHADDLRRLDRFGPPATSSAAPTRARPGSPSPDSPPTSWPFMRASIRRASCMWSMAMAPVPAV